MSREAFRIELEHLINRESMEARGANTPDGILADCLVGCLQVFDRTVRARESWYGRNPERGPASAGELVASDLEAARVTWAGRRPEMMPTADEPTPVERPQRDLAVQLVEALETWMRRRHLRIGVGWTDERENVCSDPRYKAAMEAAGTYGDLGDGKGYGYPGSPDGQLTSVPAHIELLKALDADISDAKGDVLDIIREMIPSLPR